jgi:hypothetical protein
MDIDKILNDLGLDFSNPETKKGALEALEAILDSRASIDLGAGGFGAGATGGETDVEIDPDLLQPSSKNPASDLDMDIEINDEEDILSQVKQNDSDEESTSNNTSSSNQGSSSGDQSDSGDTSSDVGDSDSNKVDDDTTEADVSDADDYEDEETSDDFEYDEDSDEEASKTDANGSATEDELDSGDDSDASADDEEDDAEAEDGEFDEDSDEDGESGDGANTGDKEASEDETNTESDDEDEEDFDETDLLDDTYNDLKDIELKTKHEARKIKRERTLTAAKKALADAQARKVAPALIRELEKAIEDLESLTEAVKSIKDISDEEFNLKINRVFDAIDAVGDKSLTFSSDEERQLKAQEIKADLAKAETRNELSAEDIAKIRAEHQAVQAREKDVEKYKAKSRSSFKGFQDFLQSLYRAVALQVATEETRDDSWSAISRRNSGAGVLRQGKKINELPNKKIPVIDFYFDQSGSWDESDIKVGEKAVQSLAEMEENGDIKINIYYFSNHVFTDAQSARNEGGTAGWNDIVKNVISTQATNVIIMTDDDMENWWNPQDKPPLNYIVPGYVWYLWRNGSNAPRLPRDLKGRGGTQQFSFGTGD